MATFLNQLDENDILVFYEHNEKQYKEALDHYSNAENWKTIPLKELTAIPWEQPKDCNGQMKLTENGIVETFSAIRKELEEHFSTDELVKVAKDASFFAKTSSGTLYPVRETGLFSWSYRAGWANSPNVLGSTTKHRSAFPSEERAKWLNIGSSNSSELITLYCPDNTIWYVGSERYTILPPLEGSNIVRNYLNQEFPDNKFREARISHKLLWEDIYINDELEESSFSLSLSELIKKKVKAKFFVRFSTGNIGDSVMKAQMYMEITILEYGLPTHIVTMPLGSGEKIYHLNTKAHLLYKKDGQHSFEEKISSLASVISDAETQIETLGRIKLTHVKGFMFWLYHHTISKNSTKEARNHADAFAFSHSSPTAIDVYLYLLEQAESKKTLVEVASWLEKVSKILFMSEKQLKDYDKELPPEE